MIGLIIASAINLAGLQASISAPTITFRTCLREAAVKAKSDKIPADGIEAYLRNACTGSLGSLKEALIQFRLKNGMTRKAAASDAEMTVDDYVSTPADNYKFMASQDAKSQAPAASSATPAPTPASAPSQPKAQAVGASVTPASAPSQPPKP
jgi:hypothetical protein